MTAGQHDTGEDEGERIPRGLEHHLREGEMSVGHGSKKLDSGDGAVSGTTV
jgi:hypothetical protein